MPYYLQAALYAPDFLMALEHEAGLFYPRYWPSEAQAIDACIACLGCPL